MWWTFLPAWIVSAVLSGIYFNCYLREKTHRQNLEFDIRRLSSELRVMGEQLKVYQEQEKRLPSVELGTGTASSEPSVEEVAELEKRWTMNDRRAISKLMLVPELQFFSAPDEVIISGCATDALAEYRARRKLSMVYGEFVDVDSIMLSHETVSMDSPYPTRHYTYRLRRPM